MAHFRDSIRELFRSNPERLSKLLADGGRVEKKFQAETPQKVVDLIREPYPSEVILAAIVTMQWQVFVSEGPQWFITSDNPFFFTRGICAG